MRFTTILPFAGIATAFILPDAQVFSDLAIETQDPIFAPHSDEADSWGVENVHEDAFDEDNLASYGWPVPGHGHEDKNLTIYEIISKSPYTTNFSKLIDEYDDLVELLNSTTTNYTLFVPTDKAFEHLPKDKKPSKDVIEAILRYHIGYGFYPAGRILRTHTIPSTLDEPFLGGHHQRLRTSVGLGGVRVNFYSKVFYVNYFASNGVIHAVDHILVPPPMVGRQLTLFPQVFSTLLLAYEKTNFTDFIHHVKMNGTTVFAPTNRAFEALGLRANAFLFNTEKGLKYLNALLKYHIVANATLYSDAFYQNNAEAEEWAQDGHCHGRGGERKHGPKDGQHGPPHDGPHHGPKDGRHGPPHDGPRRGPEHGPRHGPEDGPRHGPTGGHRHGGKNGHTHIDLPTLLYDKPVAIDIARWGGIIRMRINGHVPVVVQDGIAKNGVVQLVGRVLIPPHHHKGKHGHDHDGGEIEVEDLIKRLEPFVEGEKKQSKSWWDFFGNVDL